MKEKETPHLEVELASVRAELSAARGNVLQAQSVVDALIEQRNEALNKAANLAATVAILQKKLAATMPTA